MEASNHFTCLSYDTVDFLIQSRYVLFGIYLKQGNNKKNISFEGELLPQISIGSYLENFFLCKPAEECHVMLVMKKDDFDKDLQKQIVDFTATKFPASGYFAVSVNSEVTSRIIDISFLRTIPKGIRLKQNECGVSAIGFQQDAKDSSLTRKEILLAPDSLLRKYISCNKDA